MKSNVLLFPQYSPEPVSIPTPANWREGDVYLFLEFGENEVVPAGFFPESKLFFRAGERRSGMVHALGTPAGVMVARLRFPPGERAVSVPLTPGAPAGDVALSSLKILGWMDEAYLEGWGGARLVIPLEELAAVAPDLPLFVTSSSL